MSNRVELLKYLDNLNCFFTPSNSEEYNGIIYANIRSLRKNFNSFILELGQIKCKISIIVLSEIWINSEEIDLYSIPGYNTFHICNDNYRAGGVVCYIDKEINVTNLDINLDTADALTLKISFKNYFFNLICLYRLQNQSVKDFIEEFSVNFANLASNCILIGDINLNLLENSQTTQNYMSMLSSMGFVQAIDCPTRITDQSKTCLDHIFIRHRDLSLFRAAVFDINLTDHCLLGLKISNRRINVCPQNSNTKYQTIKEIIDYAKVKQKIQNINFNSLLLQGDVNYCFNSFHDILGHIIDESKIKKCFNSKLDKARERSPWINSKILSKLDRKKNFIKFLKEDLMTQTLKISSRSFVQLFQMK